MYLNLPRYPRFLTAAAGSFFMTTGLVYLMVQLIAIDDLGLTEATIFDPIDIYEVRDEPEPPTREQPVEPPPKAEVPPPPPPAVVAGNEGSPIEFAFVAPEAKSTISIGGASLIEGDPIPIVKVAPAYPNRAATRGIEGYVILSFTITETGATADATVIESHPSDIFNRSALSAVKKFKYKPKVVDGQAESVHNVQHRLTFELTNG